MTDIKSLYASLLKNFKVTSKDLRKRQNIDTRKAILDQLIAAQRGQSKSKEQTLKTIRKELKEDGFKFSNELGRDLYDAQSKRFVRGTTGTRGKGSNRPNIKKIPTVSFKFAEDGWFMYAALVYCSTSRLQKNRKTYPFIKFPKNKKIIKLNPSATRYQKTEDFSFWSPLLMSRNEVEKVFFDILSGKTKLGSVDYIEGSNRMDIDFSITTPIAFKYDRVLRNEY